MQSSKIQVAAAVIERDGRILIGQRKRGSMHSLKWEFPGGKLDPGETPRQALERELREELAIEAVIGEELDQYDFQYPGRAPTQLYFFRVTEFSGEPQNLDFEQLAWERPRLLPTYDFLEGDVAFVRKLAMVPDISIGIAQPSDCGELARLHESLWPDSSAEEHARELAPILAGKAPSTLPFICFVAKAGDGGDHNSIVGFLEAGLRSHADGCETSRPVGFIEGWYVAEDHRNRGIGSRLAAAAEDWARAQGCTEMASDTWIDAELSQRVHQALGYIEVDRCVHFRKPLS